MDINDELAFASFVVISDTELIEKCAPLLAKKIGECDAIVTAEAKGIALAYKISEILGLKEFIVARKSEKTYMKDKGLHKALLFIFVTLDKAKDDISQYKEEKKSKIFKTRKNNFILP